jgi:hypothetical protein
MDAYADRTKTMRFKADHHPTIRHDRVNFDDGNDGGHGGRPTMPARGCDGINSVLLLGLRRRHQASKA